MRTRRMDHLESNSSSEKTARTYFWILNLEEVSRLFLLNCKGKDWLDGSCLGSQNMGAGEYLGTYSTSRHFSGNVGSSFI